MKTTTFTQYCHHFMTERLLMVDILNDIRCDETPVNDLQKPFRITITVEQLNPMPAPPSDSRSPRS